MALASFFIDTIDSTDFAHHIFGVYADHGPHFDFVVRLRCRVDGSRVVRFVSVVWQ